MTRNLPLLLLFFLFVSTPLYADTVPPFSFTDLTGKTYRSDDLRGSPLVINVGAHW